MLRWVAPPHARVHPRLALVRHADRLFSFAELVRHTPFEFAMTGPDEQAGTPQAWWDDLLARSPSVARAAASRCVALDFEVLDLYALEAVGSA